MVDRSLLNTLAEMKKLNNVIKLEEKTNVDVFWKEVPIEKLGGRGVESEEREGNVTPELQGVFPGTNLHPVEKLSNDCKVILQNLLESLNYRTIDL